LAFIPNLSIKFCWTCENLTEGENEIGKEEKISKSHLAKKSPRKDVGEKGMARNQIPLLHHHECFVLKNKVKCLKLLMRKKEMIEKEKFDWLPEKR